MKYTIKDIKKGYTKEKARSEPIWGRLFIRRLSFPLSVLAINIGISANMVSFISCIIALVSGIVLCINTNISIWIGIILVNVWAILDCVDGNIARTKGNLNLTGNFFDAIGGYSINAFATIGIGVAAYNTTHIFKDEFKLWLIIIGAFGAISDILLRLIYQKFSSNMMRMEAQRIGLDALTTDKDKIKEQSTSLREKLFKLALGFDYKFGLGGNEGLILILTYILGYIDIMCIFFSLYRIFGLIFMGLSYIKRMIAYEKKYFS